MISSSVTFTTMPFDSRIAMSALSALRGTPTGEEGARGGEWAPVADGVDNTDKIQAVS